MYQFVFGSLACSLIGGLSFFRDYDPLQVFLRNIIKLLIGFKHFPPVLIWLIKFTSFVASTVVITHLTCVNTSVILLIIIFLEGIAIKSTKDLFPKAAQTVPKHYYFMSCLRKFRHIQIFIANLDQFLYWYVAVLTTMGILATSASGFVTVTMYSSKEIPFIIYICACMMFVGGIFLNFLLIILAAVPNIYAIQFKHYWKCKVESVLSLRYIKSCPSIGFTVGVIRKVKRQTALTIADTELNFTATMVLTERNM